MSEWQVKRQKKDKRTVLLEAEKAIFKKTMSWLAELCAAESSGTTRSEKKPWDLWLLIKKLLVKIFLVKW